MSTGDNYYAVVYSAAVMESLKAIGARANSAGHKREFILAVKQIHSWLQADPESFGEPYRDFVELELVGYVGIVRPRVVRYGIHKPKRIVFVSFPIQTVANSPY